MEKNKKGSISASAMSILIICFQSVNDECNSVVGEQCSSGV